MNAELLNAVRYFTRDTGILDCLSVACGGPGWTEEARDGRDASENALYDLASVTKLFTSFCALRLREEGLLDFSRSISDYEPRFRFLSGVTVEEALTFQRVLRTPARLDEAGSREEALALLADTYPAPEKPGRRPYSDIPAMVVKYVLERASRQDFFSCVRDRVLLPAGMTETFALVPENRVEDCLLYGPEYRLEKGVRKCRTDPRRGVPHDPKAAVIQGRTGDLCGHAGLFSSLRDMVKMCRAVLDGRILSAESLRYMAVNRTGRMLEDGNYSQFLGCMCYVKHPVQYWSEIPAHLSSRAFGIGGFTGTHVSIDPEKGLFTVMLGNRVRDRLTVLLPEEGRTLTDYGLREDGSGRFRWSETRELFSSVQYVHQKDEHLHSVIARLAARQM